jgi:membrane protease YdiL (CAAX protease family)
LVPIFSVMLLLTVTFEPTVQHPLIERLLDNHSLAMMAAAAFTAIVAAPIYEEVAFRLVLQGWLERVDGAYCQGDAPLLSGVEAPRGSHEAMAFAGPSGPQWGPIIISGTLFGLAHWGHGVSPAPLILLGFILGYVYQRTHRIVPCIACHMIFNAFTFVLLAFEFSADK